MLFGTGTNAYRLVVGVPLLVQAVL